MKRLMSVLLLVSLLVFSSSYVGAERYHIGHVDDVDFYLLTESVSVQGNYASAAILRDWNHGGQEYIVTVLFSPWGDSNMSYKFANAFGGQWMPVRSGHWSGNAVAWMRNHGY